MDVEAEMGRITGESERAKIYWNWNIFDIERGDSRLHTRCFKS